MESWLYYWFEQYFKNAEPVSVSNPLAVGWCVYRETYELD